MKGIVVLTTVMSAIVEARIDAAGLSGGAASSVGEQTSLTTAGAEDSQRQDNTIHGIINSTRNPAFKEYLAGLDSEIHQVFDATDAERLQALELMEGIVILSGIVHAIAEARLGSGAPEPVITVSGTDGNFTILGGAFSPGERVIITIAHTATAAVYIKGSLLNEQIAANENDAFQADGTLPLGAGVFTLEATGADSRLQAAAPVVVVDGN